MNFKALTLTLDVPEWTAACLQGASKLEERQAPRYTRGSCG